MWTIAAVNKKFEGLLGSYNGLKDVHLAHFFSQPSRQSHLKAARLITKDGFIVPEKNVKKETHVHEKRRKMYDIFARSILQNAVYEEGSWNQKLCNYLEDISKIATVDTAKKRMKKKSSKVASELHPFSYNMHESVKSCKNVKHPKSAPLTCVCFIKEGQQKIKKPSSAHEYSPYSMPPILSESYKEPLFDSDKTVRRKLRKLTKSVGNSNTMKNNFSNYYIKASFPYQALKLSQSKITMFYHGHLHLMNTQKALTRNILIRQQHCGGTPVVIYKGKVSANEFFSFFPLDHEGFFFSLTVFLNGIRELKLSSCCVFRYLAGRRNGVFSIQKIEGGKPCLKCQYEEYETNKLKVVIQQSSKISVNEKNSSDDFEGDKTLLENSKPSSLDEPHSRLDDESQRVKDNESHTDNEIEEILDDGTNQSFKEEVSETGSLEDQKQFNSYEDEIKGVYMNDVMSINHASSDLRTGRNINNENK